MMVDGLPEFALDFYGINFELELTKLPTTTSYFGCGNHSHVDLGLQ